MPVPEQLEGWKPEPDSECSLARLVELAFDYRGDTTVIKHDGEELLGFVFNHKPQAAEPCLQMYQKGQPTPLSVPFAAIRTIHFTGKDTAA